MMGISSKANAQKTPGFKKYMKYLRSSVIYSIVKSIA